MVTASLLFCASCNFVLCIAMPSILHKFYCHHILGMVVVLVLVVAGTALVELAAQHVAGKNYKK